MRDRRMPLNALVLGALLLVGTALSVWAKPPLAKPAGDFLPQLALPPLPAIAEGLFGALRLSLSKSRAEVWLNPLFYGMTAAILLLERRWPVHPQQRILSLGLLQDAVWLLGDFVIKYCFLIQYAKGLNWFYSQFLRGWQVNLPQLLHLPGWLVFVFAIVFTDFLSWLAHFLLHQHPWLWRFHAVHHSQREMNLFTDLRFHFGEALIAYPLLILPMRLLHISLPYQGYYLIFRVWYARFYHANIRTNLGWLKYILVTPQSHRVHHSIEPRQYNQNYGVLFSCWDYLFKTQYPDTHVYPPTGIDDPHFPIAQKFNLPSVLKTYWAQQLYPFYRQS